MTGPRPLVAAILIVLTAVLSARAGVNAGDKVDFTLKLMDRSTVSVADLNDKLTVVEFWATWCGPCVQMLPHLKEMNETYAPRGVELISVSLDRKAADAQRFIQKNQMTWAQAHEGSQPRPLSDQWGVSGIPHAFIIAPGGEVLWRGHPARMEAEIEKALEVHGDKLVASSLELKPAIREMLRARRELAKGPEAVPEVMPKVAQLILMIPVEHYENRVMAKTAVKLHAALDEADPDGTLLRAALDARSPTEAQTPRIDAFMEAGEAEADAEASREAA